MSTTVGNLLRNSLSCIITLLRNRNKGANMFSKEQQQYLVEFFNNKQANFAEDGADSDAADCALAAETIAKDASVNTVKEVFSGFDFEADLLEELAEVDERNDIVEILCN